MEAYKEVKRVPVDSGKLMVIDPCHLPDELVEKLTSPNEHGVAVAVVYPTPHGDGWFPVFADNPFLSVAWSYNPEDYE